MSEHQSSPGKIIEGHAYDGIEELDNPLPAWWIGGFYLTILFAAVYCFYYMVAEGPSIQTEYRHESEAYEYSLYLNRGAAPAGPGEDELRALLKQPERLKAGHEVFTAKCAACHGAQGQGGIGPNLTDDYWIKGGKMTEILNTVTHGSPEKGMPPWGPLLKPEEILSVVAHVKSLHGTNPPGAKAPQGELVKE